MRRFNLKVFDYIIVSAVAVLVVFMSFRIYSSESENTVLKISAANTEYIYPLDQELEIDVEGPIGITRVLISNGTAQITESPCEDKLCILMGKISRPGQWAACMPNRVFISIEGSADDQEIDILSY